MHTDKEIALLLHKANSGDPNAQLELGTAYIRGDGVRMDLDQATRWLTESAKVVTAAQTKLGEVCELRGKLKEAEDWYIKAVNNKDPRAMYRLGYLMYTCKLGLKPTGEGLDLMRAAAKRGDSDAKRYIDTYIDDPVIKRARRISEYRLRASDGDVVAQYQLGCIYESGIDVPIDFIEAARWYKAAADGGHSISMYRLGMMYFEGRGLPRDEDEAVRNISMAANLGNTDARRFKLLHKM